MKRQLVTSIILLPFLNYIIGCTTLTVVNSPRDRFNFTDPDSVKQMSTHEFRAIYLASGDSVVYDAHGARYYPRVRGQNSMLVGKTAAGAVVLTPIGEVDSVSEYHRVLDSKATTWALAGLAAVVVLVIVWPDNWNLDYSRMGDADIEPIDWP